MEVSLSAIPLTLCPLPQGVRDVISPSPLAGEGEYKGLRGIEVKYLNCQVLIVNSLKCYL